MAASMTTCLSLTFNGALLHSILCQMPEGLAVAVQISREVDTPNLDPSARIPDKISPSSGYPTVDRDRGCTVVQ